MNKKIIGILICMLLITNSIIIVSAEFSKYSEKQVFYNYDNYYPDDFELIIESGGFGPWTRLFQLYVKTSGEAYYSITYSEDRDTGNWSLIDEFEFTQSEMDQIWNQIVENDFLNLDELYSKNVEDGAFAYMKITANAETHEVMTENIEVVQFDNIVKKINELTPGDLDLFYNAIYNDPPRKPIKPSGFSSGKPNIEYTYTTSTIDFEGEKLFYWFEWGDGTNSGWVGPFDSGDMASAKHKWDSESDYLIKVKAKDDPNGDGDHSDGKESRWSDPLTVSMPKNRRFSNVFLESILQKIFYWFPFLKYIKVFDEKVSSPELAFDSLVFESIQSYTDSGTEVSIEDCNITITLKIEIYGEGADDYLVEKIQSEIEHVWGTNLESENWYIDCKEKDKTCPRLEPGCKIEFKIDVQKRNASDTPRSGYHQVNVSNDTSADGQGSYSTVDTPLPTPNGGTGTGNWDNNEHPGTYAHEAGHLLGLPDLYVEWYDENGKRHTKPKKGFDKHIMANVTGWPTRNNISDVVNAGGVYCPCDCCPPKNDTEEPDTNIQTPQDNQHVSNPLIIGGYADDGIEGSGIVMLDYLLEWNNGYYDGPNEPVDPPEQYVNFVLGPLDLSIFIQQGDWISITVFATDDAGNTGSDTVTVTWVEEEEDTTPPVTEKTVGEPNEDGGYIIWPFTPIYLEAIDDMSGVKYIYYEIAWDTNEDGIWDELFQETIYNSYVEIQTLMYGILSGIIELRWYAVDNVDNVEEMHYQKHLVATW